MSVVRICRAANWENLSTVDVTPRAVRWQKASSSKELRKKLKSPTKWHYTEGNGKFSACGLPVGFASDGQSTYPQIGEIAAIDCENCCRKMKE